MERLRNHYLHEAEFLVDDFTANNEEVFVIRVGGLNAAATENTIREQFRGLFGGPEHIVRVFVLTIPGQSSRTGFIQYRTRESMLQCIRRCYSADYYQSNLIVERVFAEEMHRHVD